MRRPLRGLTAAVLRQTAVDRLVSSAGGVVLHCFGDSHAAVFRRVRAVGGLRRTWLEVSPIDGATALGLANPNSTTQALPRFSASISRLPLASHLAFMLGEVDCGFLIWYRAEQKGARVRDEFERSLGTYTRFLDDLRSAGRASLLVATVPPPTIDSRAVGAVANARRHVRASLRDRTQLTTEYNGRLREWAARTGCVFLDYERELLDGSTGLVRGELRNSDPTDHHLDMRKHAAILARSLQAAGYR